MSTYSVTAVTFLHLCTENVDEVPHCCDSFWRHSFYLVFLFAMTDEHLCQSCCYLFVCLFPYLSIPSIWLNFRTSQSVVILVTQPMMFVAAVKFALSLWYVAFHISFDIDLTMDTLNRLVCFKNVQHTMVFISNRFVIVKGTKY